MVLGACPAHFEGSCAIKPPTFSTLKACRLLFPFRRSSRERHITTHPRRNSQV